MNYPSPVDELLTYGEPDELDEQPDYLALGLGPEHIPDLIRMATDSGLWRAGWKDVTRWAPLHACRALGQLRAEAAIEPLLSLLRSLHENEDTDDLLDEALPYVMEQIGPVAIPALTACLADKRNRSGARTDASFMLLVIGQGYPEARAACVAALTRQLEQLIDAEYDPELCSYIVEDLTTLKAVEAAPVIERAFAARRLDEFISGDWEDVQIQLGLKERPETSANRSQPKRRNWSLN